MPAYILSIDQGTTSSRAIIFDKQGKIIASAQQEFKQYYPRDGWVEHDPEEIWQTTLTSCRGALEKANLSAAEITTAGITNQRETTVVWNRETGKPIYPAIVWQDRRTADYCRNLAAQGHAAMLQEKTGLRPDAYFSASKIRWILDEVPSAREQAEAGQLAFGTIDSWLIWKLSKGQSHVTDATNASRTLLFNINTQQWDSDLCQLLDIPITLLPTVKDCADEFGYIHGDWLGHAVPIQGVAGDQQAALIGQACFQQGMAKSTYGTGCFLVLNTGDKVLKSQNQLLSTIAYRINGEVTYALEGSIFIAGAAMQWLRDELKLIKSAADSEQMAALTGIDNSVYLVPAFTGLGAPYWDPDARGALFGLTRDTGVEEIVTATLQSVCYQTRDLQLAMEHDGVRPHRLRVDGGMVANNWVMQFLADMLNVTIERPHVIETTALGAAYLAGLQAGVYQSLDDIADHWACQQQFMPHIAEKQRDKLYSGWLDAVERTKSR